MDGDRCTTCGQVGLELEDECPGGALDVPQSTQTTSPRSFGGQAQTTGAIKALLHSRDLPKRKSFNDAQNASYLDMVARALMKRIPEAIKRKENFTGADLKECLRAYNMEARHTDQCDAGL